MADLIAILHTTDYRGDHAADVEIPCEIKPGETVKALAARLLHDGQFVQNDYIAIKRVHAARTSDAD